MMKYKYFVILLQIIVSQPRINNGDTDGNTGFGADDNNGNIEHAAPDDSAGI